MPLLAVVLAQPLEARGVRTSEAVASAPNLSPTDAMAALAPALITMRSERAKSTPESLTLRGAPLAIIVVPNEALCEQVGGIACEKPSAELTYGLERLAMYIQGVENVYDLDFNGEGVKYGDVFLRAEREYSAHNFEAADTKMLFRHFEDAEAECAALLERKLALPAYDQCIKASHRFNLLDARGAISVTERAAYIGRVRALAKGCCEAWLAGEGA
jgi:hypothetical protein